MEKNSQRVQTRKQQLCRLNKLRNQKRKDRFLNEIKILFALVLLLSVLIFALPFSKDKVVASGNLEKTYIYLEVEAGDTLWGYAQRFAHKDFYRDNQEYIQEVHQLNRIYGNKIFAGKRILLPIIEYKKE